MHRTQQVQPSGASVGRPEEVRRAQSRTRSICSRAIAWERPSCTPGAIGRVAACRSRSVRPPWPAPVAVPRPGEFSWRWPILPAIPLASRRRPVRAGPIRSRSLPASAAAVATPRCVDCCAEVRGRRRDDERAGQHGDRHARQCVGDTASITLISSNGDIAAGKEIHGRRPDRSVGRRGGRSRQRVGHQLSRSAALGVLREPAGKLSARNANRPTDLAESRIRIRWPRAQYGRADRPFRQPLGSQQLEDLSVYSPQSWRLSDGRLYRSRRSVADSVDRPTQTALNTLTEHA
jgi:hypothetical protein